VDRDDERQLVARAREGDAEAFRTLCDRYEEGLRKRIGHWVNGRVTQKVSVSDVLQESYITAHDRISDFEDRGEGAFRAWIAQIAEFKAKEALRRYVGTGKREIGREAPRDARPESAMLAGHGPSPSELVIAKERLEEIQRAMARLPGHYREVLRLVQGEGLKLSEVAARLDRSYEATKKLYGRALSQLAERLRVDRTGRDLDA
jgi:RNA polymerase sigma-70 factor (ECF subfamily)